MDDAGVPQSLSDGFVLRPVSGDGSAPELSPLACEIHPSANEYSLGADGDGGVNNGWRRELAPWDETSQSYDFSPLFAPCPSTSSSSSSTSSAGGDVEYSRDARKKEKANFQGFSNCRILKTVSVCACFAGMGLTSPLLGMTVVHLERLLSATTRTIALTFIFQAIGYTIGGFLCGLIYDRINPELGFIASILVQAAATVASGYAPGIAVFLVWIAVQGFAYGYVETGGQSYSVNLWSKHRLKEPILQGLHTIWSLAATIAPFLVYPFLIDFAINSPDDSSAKNSSANEYKPDSERTSPSYLVDFNSSFAEEFDDVLRNRSTVDSVPEVLEVLEGIERVRYAYLVVGILVFSSCLSFVVVYLHSCSPFLLPRKQIDAASSVAKTTTTSSSTRSHVNRRALLRIVFIALLFVVCLLNACCENIPEAYLTMFVIKYLGWSVHRSTLVVSIFYGTQCAGCLIGVGLSTVLRPRTMIGLNVSVSVLAYLLLLVGHGGDAIVFVSVALAGYGTSSTFAAIVLWVSEYVAVNGCVAATLTIGSAVGDMVGPLAVGHLLEIHSSMWFVYSLMFTNLALLTFCAVMLVFLCRSKRTLSEDTTNQPLSVD